MTARNKRYFAPYSLPHLGVPRKVPAAKFLWHNHVQHCVGMAHGLNGFRYRAGWLPVDYKTFMRCDCGVISLPHYCIRAARPQRCVSEHAVKKGATP